MSEPRYAEDGNLDLRSDQEREQAEQEAETPDEYYKESPDDE